MFATATGERRAIILGWLMAFNTNLLGGIEAGAGLDFGLLWIVFVKSGPTQAEGWLDERSGDGWSFRFERMFRRCFRG
jgi:hypothetical protein